MNIEGTVTIPDWLAKALKDERVDITSIVREDFMVAFQNLKQRMAKDLENEVLYGDGTIPAPRGILNFHKKDKS